MKRIVLWFLSTVSAVVLLFGYHTSTSATPGTPTAIVSSSSGTTSSGTTSSGTTSGSGSSGSTSSGSGSSDSSGSSSGSSSSGSSSSGGSSSGGSSSGSSSSTSATSTVTGDVADTRWGPVQVELTLKGKSITRVDVLQYPSGNGRDAEINSYALPVLIQETMDQQNAQIDMVSGATVTSEGYLQSLQSALDQAGE